MPTLPRIDFIIIGAAKCATTWLQRALCAAPDVWMPAPELHYFSDNYHLGPEWYRDQFAGAGSARILGEKSNSYLSAPEAARRIHRDYPDARLIVQMREPVSRAYSDYCMLFRRGEVTSEIRRHLDPDRAAGERFLANGRYARMLEPYLDLFGPDALLALVYEEVVADPERHLARIATHIGLRTPPPVPRERVKDRAAPLVPLPLRRLLAPARPLLDPIRTTSPVRALRDLVARPVSHPELPPELAQRIAAFYRADIDRLEQATGCKVLKWREKFEGKSPKPPERDEATEQGRESADMP